jgi:hypothetical protein
MPGTQPNPVWLYRLIHVDNLPLLLQRDALHAPHATPADGLAYRPIHDVSVQGARRVQTVPCGPGGNIHDYVPFYFGPLSPMLLKLKSGQVAGYNEGQEPLLYLVTRIDDVQAAGCRYVFSDGHGLAAFTRWYDDVAHLNQVDWNIIAQRYWSDRPDDNDRQRRKQAEFLVWQSLPWSRIHGIAVLNDAALRRVAAVLAQYPQRHRPQLKVVPGWYY